MPPLTPGISQKVGEALELTYSNWSLKAQHLGIPTDPRAWTVEQVCYAIKKKVSSFQETVLIGTLDLSQVNFWLAWTIQEFSFDIELYSDFIERFQVSQFQF